jgi:hypothetical protein
MTTSIGADTITVRRAPLIADGRYGADRRDWATATAIVISGVSVQPFSAAEQTLDREYTATRLRLFAPPGTDLISTDRVEWRGVMYEVDGEPDRWFDEGQADHIEAVITRMTG